MSLNNGQKTLHEEVEAGLKREADAKFRVEDPVSWWIGIVVGYAFGLAVVLGVVIHVWRLLGLID